jgi:hypothetical protein
MALTSASEADREKALKDLITAFGWRGRRGLSAEVGWHPNDFLLYAFLGSMKNVGVALRTALRNTSESITLVGDRHRIEPLRVELQSAGFTVSVIAWHYGEPAPILRGPGRSILCEIPQSYADYSSLFELHDISPGLSTLWELTFPLSVLLETMLLLDYNIGIEDQNNKLPETLELHERYFEAMCSVYSGKASLLPCLPKVLEFLDVKGKTVIEFGPSDGIHTGFLTAADARQVTVVEGRPENVVKLLAAQYAFGWKNLEVFTDNFQYPGVWASRRYDAVFAHGVFYHCLYPFYFMDLMTQLSDKIFLGGWVATDTKPLSEWRYASYRGRNYRVQVYDEPSHFCSGLAARSTFLDAEGVEQFFQDRGFHVELLERDSLPHGLTDSFLRWIIKRA